ncbi:LysR family transcriptional regulator [Izhakiella australiensis]|uniref:LysR family transcriptional regulator n=1 Tax=Izhakiella australiensis TaxID=1926881 RepID=A0A1S8YSC6_9GAMM|nr:LysR family transcriptional regulator [Izhakiella australiensis]OON41980.1 LysR family transcriptional regulator [Izhakiella australiensis]
MPAAIKLHQLRAFVAVARLGSIRAASRAAHLSQPALTKSIQELEDGVGAKLFIRRRQGVVMTNIGESFFKHASLILEELRVAQEDIQQRLGLAGGSVNIGVGGSIARTIMPQVITRFHREYPNVKIRIVEGQLVSMIPALRQGELDFTINTYYQGHLDNELSYEYLMDREYQVVVRRGHPLEHATSITQLLECDWTMPTPNGSYYRLLHDLFADRDMMPKISVTCETFMACTSLVAQSDFVSILSRDVISDPILGNHLVPLAVCEPLPKAGFYLIQRKDTALTPMGASLAQLFRQQCRVPMSF